MSGEKLKGIPYTGTLPATLTGTKAGYLHRYKIYGNTEQTGVPTPENPVEPAECGERTENLFDKTATDTNNGYVNNKYLTRLGEYYNNNDYAVSEYIEVAGNTTYTFTSNFTATSPSICFYDAQKVFLSGYRLDGNSIITVTSDNTAVYARISYRKDNINVTMFTAGSTALPYEPYGYKLPLLSGSTPVDIYLGESQATRRIEKLILTGEETVDSESNMFHIRFANKGTQTSWYNADCTHFVRVSSYNECNSASSTGKFGVANRSSQLYIWFNKSGFATSTDFKSYLQQQYANGTPVTVWYVLATEETGVLNEPLRKIGDYADTIDSTQTTTQIPTTANSTTISWAGSGLAPSEFDSIQEWVDIPTYTYTNGEWVADNSN